MEPGVEAETPTGGDEAGDGNASEPESQQDPPEVAEDPGNVVQCPPECELNLNAEIELEMDSASETLRPAGSSRYSLRGCVAPPTRLMAVTACSRSSTRGEGGGVTE